MRKGRRKLTRAQERALCDLYVNLSCAQLARAFGMTPAGVSAVLRRNGVERRPPGHAAWSRARYAARAEERAQ